MTSVCHEAPQFLFEFWRPAQGVSWPASDSAQDFNGSRLSFCHQKAQCSAQDFNGSKFSFCHQKSQCLSPGLYWLEGSSFLTCQWLEGSFFLHEGLATSDDTWSARPNAQPRTWMAGGLFSFLSGLLLMTSGLPSEGPTLSLAFRIMIRSGCAVELRSGCAIGVRSGCAVGVRSGCAVGSRSGCAVGVRPGCAVGLRSGCAIGLRSGCAVGSLAFREARFEKLEIEKLNFEAGSSVLKLLKFEPWKLHFKASRLCREAPKWSFQKLHFGASGLHTVTLKSFGGCLQTSSMSFFFY